MKLEKYFFPLMIVAAVVGLWIALRPKNGGAQVSNQPSASSSGVPQYSPQAVNYQVNPPQLSSPTPLQLLSNPWDANPGQPLPANPPAYLAFNLGPGHDLTKVPLTPLQLQQMAGNRNGDCGSCGCGGDACANDPNNSVFPDGRGAVMAKSGPQLLQKMKRTDATWLDRAAYNLAGSDVLPSTLPNNPPTFMPGLPPVSTGNPTQIQPAAPSKTQPPSAPGTQGPRILPVTNEVMNKGKTTVDLASQLAGNLYTYGNQTTKLSGSLLNRLTNTNTFVS